MPYLQLDVNEHYSVADKRRLAKEMSGTYARDDVGGHPAHQRRHP